jgi:hypothetical protein
MSPLAEHRARDAVASAKLPFVANDTEVCGDVDVGKDVGHEGDNYIHVQASLVARRHECRLSRVAVRHGARRYTNCDDGCGVTASARSLLDGVTR